jgi:hypothetical protein
MRSAVWFVWRGYQLVAAKFIAKKGSNHGMAQMAARRLWRQMYSSAKSEKHAKNSLAWLSNSLQTTDSDN